MIVCLNLRIFKSILSLFLFSHMEHYRWQKIGTPGSTCRGSTKNEVIDDCLFKFENFQKHFIIIPLFSLNPLIIEEKPFITVQSPPGFINKSNETRCYLNAIFQNLYYNVFFREMVFKINCYTILNDLVSGCQYFVHNFQKNYDFQGVTETFQCDIFRWGKNHIHWYVLHFGKYHN